jgi:SAM-dependent methyltransferase
MTDDKPTTPADVWHKLYADGTITPPRWPDETMCRWLDMLKLVNRAEGRILEIGCGAGRNLVGIEDMGFEAYGIDYSETAVEKATARLSDYPPLYGEELDGRVVQGDIIDLPWPDGHFRAVVEVNVLEHLLEGDRKKAVREVARVLEEGGDAFFRLMGSASFGERLHERLFDVVQKDGIYIHTFTMPDVFRLFYPAGLALIGNDMERKCHMGMGLARTHWLVWARKLTQ